MRLEPTARWSDDKVALFLLTPDAVGDAYVGWLNDGEVNRYLESRFVRHDLESTASFVATMLASERDLFLGIRDRELGRHVGNIKLGPIDRRHGLGEIGILIGDRQAWGRGIARHAIGLLAEIARAELRLRKLSAGCYGDNVGSRKAFENAGFHVEAVRPGHVLIDGRRDDLILMGLFLDDGGH